MLDRYTTGPMRVSRQISVPCSLSACQLRWTVAGTPTYTVCVRHLLGVLCAQAHSLVTHAPPRRTHFHATADFGHDGGARRDGVT